jgi:hypothetical protein
MTKSSYKQANKKKLVREFLFSNFLNRKIVGLAGPNINEYINWCKSKGYKEIEIWENDLRIFIPQLAILNVDEPVDMKFGDILYSEENENVLYDLDFCTTIKTLKEHVKNFKDNFVMTFAIRAVGYEKTIKEFFSIRKEKILKSLEKTSPIKHLIINTPQGKYIAVSYFDTTPMCCIAKIN